MERGIAMVITIRTIRIFKEKKTEKYIDTKTKSNRTKNKQKARDRLKTKVKWCINPIKEKLN